MTKEIKKFKLSNHITGIVSAILSIIVGLILSKIYDAVQGAVESQIAAKQVEDSTAWWGLYQSMTQGNLVPSLIIIGTIVLVILFLLPLFKAMFKAAKSE